MDSPEDTAATPLPAPPADAARDAQAALLALASPLDWQDDEHVSTALLFTGAVRYEVARVRDRAHRWQVLRHETTGGFYLSYGPYVESRAAGKAACAQNHRTGTWDTHAAPSPYWPLHWVTPDPRYDLASTRDGQYRLYRLGSPPTSYVAIYHPHGGTADRDTRRHPTPTDAQAACLHHYTTHTWPE